MGIAPITNLIPLPITRSIGSELEPMPMERVENSARAGDDAYSPSNGKSARGSEDDGSEDEFDDLDDEVLAERASQPTELSAGRKVSFFA